MPVMVTKQESIGKHSIQHSSAPRDNTEVKPEMPELSWKSRETGRDLRVPRLPSTIIAFHMESLFSSSPHWQENTCATLTYRL